MTRNVFLVKPNGTAIRALREAKSSSLLETATAAGISPSYLAQVERGERCPRPATITRIAGALKVPVEAITQERFMTTAIDEDADLRLYSAEQVSDLWGVSKSWLQKAAAAGLIEATYLVLPGRSKGLLRFSEAQVRTLLARFTRPAVNAA